MKYVSWLGVAAVALILMSCASRVADTVPPASSRYDDVTDFNGEWNLVPTRSDDGRDWLDERSRLGMDDWGTSDRTTVRTERVRYRAWFLPDEFRIDGDRGLLRIEDPSGDVIAELDLDDDDRYGTYDDRADGERDYENRGVRARWAGDRRFEVERVNRNGRRILQTFTLENRGRRLVVGTRVERDGGTRSFTRVYQRA